MKFLTKDIEFSRYDLQRNIKLPKELTPRLAELIGIIIGDGNIYMKNKRYELHFYGDINEDKDYHEKTLLGLLYKLFNAKTDCKIKHFKNGSCRKITFESKAVTSFLTKIIGLKAGKKENIKIPKIIANGNNKIIYSFTRGLADTDFTIKFKTRYGNKNYYPIIIGNFKDKELVYGLKELFDKINFHSHIEKRNKYDKNTGKNYEGYSINIVGKDNLDKWMQKIGFSNKRHLIRYKVWKKLGFCPPYTNISKGRILLNKNL